MPAMQVILWDTRKLDASKDFAGGYGVGQYHGHGGPRGWLIRRMYKRDYRPVSLNFAYLGAIFRKLGHEVAFVEDRTPPPADLYVFNPSLITLDIERKAIEQVRTRHPRAKVLVTGLVGYTLPEAFAGLGVTIVKGEAEQLLWKLDEVLEANTPVASVGSVEDLDSLPWPDWSLFDHWKFRIGYDFSKFPTALIQQSRGCTFSCNYCPYIIVENTTRFRSPEHVVAEMNDDMKRYGFKSFKFRDPLFGLDRKRVLRLAELIGHLPRKIQFSIEGRIDLLRGETLAALKDVGLTSITVDIETPDEQTLRQYKRSPINDDRQREFVASCREMGIRTVAGFMIGFPEDTASDIRAVLRYAKAVNPTYANFNIVTPYPGTEFFAEVKDQIADFDFSKYTVYTPVLKYKNLTHDEVLALHAKCFTSYYFRWRYLQDNASLLWPGLRRFGVSGKPASRPPSDTSHSTPKRPHGLTILQGHPELRKDGPHNRNQATRSDDPKSNA